jgi:penicillin-binding protein 1A
LSRTLQGKREGASTITQQLVSDIFQLKRGEKRGDLVRQLDRKCLEIAIAFRLEWPGKDEILEAYINQINWGRQIKGIGEASRIYFEKTSVRAHAFRIRLLAGIVRGPDSFNPFRSMEAATRERNTTLERMVNARPSPARRRTPPSSNPSRCARNGGAPPANPTPWTPSAATSRSSSKNNIELGGLEIITTIDLRIQQKARRRSTRNSGKSSA